MKKGIVLLGLFVLLSVSFAASLMLNSGNLNAQVQQKVLQQKRVIPALRTSVVSVTPQKAVLTQGGDAVVVEATGTNLGLINSAQVMRAGNAVAEIEVTLDKSLLPTTLKASLKASSTAPIASDYQLAVLDSSNAKLLDVPTTVLAIEVVAPVQKAAVAQKVTTPIKAAEPVQRQVQTAPVTSLVKPAVTSVTPPKAVLTRGGEAVIVEAKGTNLTGVGSVQVTQAGAEAQGIEETLDKSQLPNTLKVSLKASSEAPVANDYQLAVFDAGSQKILDVPTAVLAVEVVAPGTKVYAAPMARKPRQQVIAPQDRIAAARTDVASISPQKAVLIQGGDPVVVEAKGAKLDTVSSARVMRAGAPVPEIEASIDRSQLPTLLKVSIKASSQAQVGTGYQLAIFDTNRRKILDVPSTALAIEVAAPTQTSTLAQRSERFPRKLPPSSTQPTTPRPTGLPYISRWEPSEVLINSEIKFFGRDIAAEYFAAKIGTRTLNITYRSPSEVRADSPSISMQGDLIVGYGTPETEYVLQPNYKVILPLQPPTIQSVSPTSFSYGDLITITGRSLNYAELWRPDTSVVYGYMKISDESKDYGEDFVRAELIQQSSDGTVSTYRVYNVCGIWADARPRSISPQPSSLSGKLRLNSLANGTRFSVASPNPVTYRGDINELVVTKIYWSRFPEISHFIVLGQAELLNRFNVEGRGLFPYRTKAMLGNVELLTNFSSHGQDGWLAIGLDAPSGPIVFTRDNLTAESSYLNVIPAPTFTPTTRQFLGMGETSQAVCNILLNTTCSLYGWYLKPSGVDGLSYEFLLDGISRFPWLQFQVLNHTASLIQFRVTLVGTLPEAYEDMTIFGGTPGTYSTLMIKAKYGTHEWELYKSPYILKVQ